MTSSTVIPIEKKTEKVMEQLIDLFLNDLDDSDSQLFLTKLSEILHHWKEHNKDLNEWQTVLSSFRLHSLPLIHNHEKLFIAENLWHQARVLIGEESERALIKTLLKHEQQSHIIREIGHLLITSFDMESLIDKVAEGVHQLGITSCFLVLYENPELYRYPNPPPDFSILLFAYTNKKRIPIPSEGLKFKTTELLPDSMLQENIFSLIMTSLFFQKEQIGYLLFERAPLEGHIYELLRRQISSSIKGSQLLKQYKQGEENLQYHQNNLENIVQERMRDLAEANQYLKAEIEERVEVEKAIKVFQSTVETSSDGVIMVTPDGHEYFRNEAFIQMYDIKENQLPISSFVNKNIGQDIFQKIKAGGSWNGEVLMYGSNGEILNILLRAYCVKNTEGQVVNLVGVHTDITKQKRIEGMIVQNEKMISLGGLAAGMAHEINNPLAGMMQTANALENRLMNQVSACTKASEVSGISFEDFQFFLKELNVPRMLTMIRESGIRASEIVQNMLSFVRKDQGSMSSYSMVELLDKSLELAGNDYNLKKKYDFREIKIIKEFESPLPMVLCEGNKIQQVLLNLLKNGAEAMKDVEKQKKSTGWVPTFTLRLFHRDETKMVTLELKDNGPGIYEKTRKRIFEPFFTTKPEGVGTGLGLSISYFIITENHQGEMAVKSKPGIGTTFILKLPASE